VRPAGARRRRRGAGLGRWLVRALAAVIIFGGGLAVGQALEERPRAGDPVTSFTTIAPWTQTATTAQTRTVTVTTP
jgi:hypothetical protein